MQLLIVPLRKSERFLMSMSPREAGQRRRSEKLRSRRELEGFGIIERKGMIAFPDAALAARGGAAMGQETVVRGWYWGAVADRQFRGNDRRKACQIWTATIAVAGLSLLSPRNWPVGRIEIDRRPRGKIRHGFARASVCPGQMCNATCQNFATHYFVSLRRNKDVELRSHSRQQQCDHSAWRNG